MSKISERMMTSAIITARPADRQAADRQAADRQAADCMGYAPALSTEREHGGGGYGGQ